MNKLHLRNITAKYFWEVIIISILLVVTPTKTLQIKAKNCNYGDSLVLKSHRSEADCNLIPEELSAEMNVDIKVIRRITTLPVMVTRYRLKAMALKGCYSGNEVASPLDKKLLRTSHLLNITDLDMFNGLMENRHNKYIELAQKLIRLPMRGTPKQIEISYIGQGTSFKRDSTFLASFGNNTCPSQPFNYKILYHIQTLDLAAHYDIKNFTLVVPRGRFRVQLSDTQYVHPVLGVFTFSLPKYREYKLEQISTNYGTLVKFSNKSVLVSFEVESKLVSALIFPGREDDALRDPTNRTFQGWATAKPDVYILLDSKITPHSILETKDAEEFYANINYGNVLSESAFDVTGNPRYSLTGEQMVGLRPGKPGYSEFLGYIRLCKRFTHYAQQSTVSLVDMLLQKQHLYENTSHSVSVVGSLISLHRCKEIYVYVDITNKNYCFNDLPVYFRDSDNNLVKAFLEPRSNKLVSYSFIVRCSVNFPVKFQVVLTNNTTKWLCYTPHHTQCKDPDIRDFKSSFLVNLWENVERSKRILDDDDRASKQSQYDFSLEKDFIFRRPDMLVQAEDSVNVPGLDQEVEIPDNLPVIIVLSVMIFLLLAHFVRACADLSKNIVPSNELTTLEKITFSLLSIIGYDSGTHPIIVHIHDLIDRGVGDPVELSSRKTLEQ